MHNNGNWPYVSSNMMAPGPSNKKAGSGMTNPWIMQPNISPDLQPGYTPHINHEEDMQSEMGTGMMQQGMGKNMKQPGMSPDMMQQGMMQPGMSPDMMQQGMMQPGMCPDMMQQGMMQPGMCPDMMQQGMMQPGMSPDMMQQKMMQAGMSPGMMQHEKMDVDMSEALELIEQAIKGETQDRLFYQYLLDNAPALLDREIIEEIRNNEIKHAKMFRQLYFEHTGKTLKPDENVTFEKPRTYCDGLRGALMGETNAIKNYRRILAAMKNRKHINMLVEIITDELRHAPLYNLLIHNNDCKY
ncbi:ferritin-like domain-containing protein [Clostridium sp. BNL1100]|uniref:ferritin family protein n=1 Tax=Clostridium sp. BNL1100 TaxID=755731 RepID=UPI00024A7BDE|nr:ferritin-like domain-containing protein [Clostridium sp. BNL1100]AEY67043.1 hypothetical protein Clo1100_2891 [Clostridium sp. BNL1100]